MIANNILSVVAITKNNIRNKRLTSIKVYDKLKINMRTKIPVIALPKISANFLNDSTLPQTALRELFLTVIFTFTQCIYKLLKIFLNNFTELHSIQID